MIYMNYLVCAKCKGYYKLKKGESLEDFKSCGCGGKLKQYGSLYEFLDEHYGLNYSEIIKENKRLKDEHTQLKETYKTLNDEYLNQASEHNGLKMDNANFESENERLKESYDTLKLERDSLNDNNKKLKEELDGLKKENQILRDDQVGYHFELEALKKHNNKYFNKNEEFEDNLEKLKYVLSKNSKSNVEKLEELKKDGPKVLENMSYEELKAAYSMLLEMFTELTEENSKLKELKKNENLNSMISKDEGIETGK